MVSMPDDNAASCCTARSLPVPTGKTVPEYVVQERHDLLP